MRHRLPRLLFSSLLVCGLAVGGVAWSRYQAVATAVATAEAAKAFVATLDDAQRAVAVLPYDSPRRVDWHFIPKDERKGLQLRDMSESQREAARKLVAATLSASGMKKAEGVVKLEGLLKVLQGDKPGPLRDTLRYYFTLFGTPGEGRWGLSIEGHHISLNFVYEGDQVVSSTPAVFCANPADVKNEGAGVPVGTRILADEELLAFKLVNSLNESQRAKGVIADKAPAEIRAPGEAQPPQDAPVGIAFNDLNPDQQEVLKRLVETYAGQMPADVAKARIQAIVGAGPDGVHFAWAGATEPGIGHYYRVQGPTFLIEFVNTQPDAAGNPANHIHCGWRDMRGDFALPAK